MKAIKSLLMAIVLILATSGCTYLAPKKLRQEAALVQTQSKIIYQARFWTDTTVSALARETNNTAPITLAKKASTEAQIMLGAHPTERFDVDAFFASNKVTMDLLVAKLKEDTKLLEKRDKQEAKLEKTEDKLQAYGQKYEEERNATIWWKFWAWSTSTLVIAGIVCLCIFTPFGPMIINTLVSLLWSAVPRVASFFKIATTSLVDNIVKGNEEAKLRIKAAPVDMGAPDKEGAYSAAQVQMLIQQDREKQMQILKDELSKATNQSDRKIIDHRKQELNYA